MAGMPDAAELRSYINDSDSSYPTTIVETALGSAIEYVYGATGRVLEPDPAPLPDPPPDPLPPDHVAKTIRVDGRWVRVPDVRWDEATTVTLDGLALDADHFRTHAHPKPRNGPVTHVELAAHRHHRHHHRSFGRSLVIDGKFGFADVPEDLRETILSLAARRIYEQTIGYADAIQTTDWGGRVYTKRVPSPLQAVISSYIVPDDLYGF